MDSYQWFNDWLAKFLNTLLGSTALNLTGFQFRPQVVSVRA